MRQNWLDHGKLNVGITFRLFFALFALCMATAIGVALATRWSFQQGFLAYLDQREVQRIETIARALGTAWETNRDWAFIRDDGKPAPGPLAILEFTADCRSGTALPRGLVLYDAQGQRVAGQPSDDRQTMAQAVVSRGQRVGTLIGTPRRALSSEAERRFQQHQIRTGWIIGLVVALLAAMLAAFLARGFLAQIKHLASGALQMASGNHEVRVRRIRSDELGTLATHFNAMAAALQDNERMRRQFVAKVSHELRTPLAILRAELEAISDGLTPVNSESIRSLQDEAKILTRLIDDLRQLAPNTVGELQYNWRELDLAKLIEDERRLWQQQFAATDMVMDIECGAELRVRGDSDRLRQLLRNLIDNAQRHAAGANRLKFLLRPENGRAVVECHDNGHGLADAAKDSLCERFWRAAPGTAFEAGGSGLGLAICRSIALAHGGQIEAEPSPLGGLCVRIYFPLLGARG